MASGKWQVAAELAAITASGFLPAFKKKTKHKKIPPKANDIETNSVGKCKTKAEENEKT